MNGPNELVTVFTEKTRIAVKDAAHAFWPDSDSDYVRIKRYMVAKSLLFAALLIINLVLTAVLAVILYSAPDASSGSVRAYMYSSVRLRGYTGIATVLDKNKNPIYTGDLVKGKATGQGELKNPDGTSVYSGEFLENRYNGEGELYYPDGKVKYRGEFKNNLFDGTGAMYYPSGAKSYEGEFSSGLKQGEGASYDEAGRMIYNGSFIGDNIFFAGYVGGDSSSLGDFGGERALYEGVYDTSVALRGFGVIYVLNNADDGADAAITRMYDVSGVASQFKEPCGAQVLRETLGKPFYAGYADILAPDLAAAEELKRLGRLSADHGLKYKLLSEAGGIYEIEYQSGQKLYLESYRDGGWFYTYYFPQRTGTYLFYSVERAGNLNGGE